ncbi:hypothetical protein [Bdellovibrio bacteriovorus]|uniref:hypothetical protein n=1 Tax=Bdellovibrio TaxID=958 RepID=UPI0035A8C87F
MKSLLVVIILLFSFSVFAQKPVMKNQNFVDRVYEIKKHKEKSLITFHREPVLYEINEGDKSLLLKLEEGQKTKKPIAVTVDPLTRKIIEVKGP